MNIMEYLAERVAKIKFCRPLFDITSMNEFKFFTGGPLATNAILLKTPQGNLLFDAPQGADAAFAGERVDWLLLTHGHFDHVMDAAAIRRRHGCKVACHVDSVPMVADGSFFKKHGFDIEFEPVSPDLLLGEGETSEVAGVNLRVLHVPGHCPGSLCFLLPGEGVLIGGDVLFREGVGRWDLPGGDGELLFEGIREKLYPLDPATRVLPGHGPETTIGYERDHNP
jgi:glyoxylase-like metal-dependent hydrolase (beta-lactamase superfamily II)